MEEDGLWKVGPYDVGKDGSLTPSVTKALKIHIDLHCHDFLVNLGASYHPLQEGGGPVSYYGAYGRFVGPVESIQRMKRAVPPAK